MDRRRFLVKGVSLAVLGCLLWPGCTRKVEAKETKTYCIDPDRCNGCGKCLRSCEASAIKFNNNIASIDPNRCTACGNCVEFCHRGAIGLSTK
ncbi:MAG: 4Fe-4S binding protein [Bacteroidales bacterium]|nr:4Fe-4S binding protein [Bacteroidales bacterium]